MPKRISTPPKRPGDVNRTAYQLVAMSKAEPESFVPPQAEPTPSITVSSVMAEMGRKGGQIGGKRRMETMTAAQRKKIAKKAAAARWGNQKYK